MQTLVSEWLRRLLGYGAAAASGVVATKVDPDVGAWVGSGIAILGAYVLNKAIPYVFPTNRKILESKPPLR